MTFAPSRTGISRPPWSKCVQLPIGTRIRIAWSFRHSDAMRSCSAHRTYGCAYRWRFNDRPHSTTSTARIPDRNRSTSVLSGSLLEECGIPSTKTMSTVPVIVSSIAVRPAGMPGPDPPN